MIPYIQTPWGSLYTYTIMVIIGVLSMLWQVHVELMKSSNREVEEGFIFPRIVAAGMTGFISSVVFDALFKIREKGMFVVSGITFYGGLIGAVTGLYLILKVSRRKTEYSGKAWFDLLTVPFILFHICGRIGCFLGGCCYGKITESSLGVVFPDNIEQGIIHGGVKRYPTQLFEVAALLLILFVILHIRERFIAYLLLYAIARFVIEFFRGDDRGYIIKGISPAQFVSVGIVLCIIIYRIIQNKKTNCRS